MESSSSQGLKVLVLAHGQCLLWHNFCASRQVSNLGFPSYLEVKVVARPAATLQFLADKAPFIFHFRPHFLVLHLGMFDLANPAADPLALADGLWRAIKLFASILETVITFKVIFVSQPKAPRHMSPDPFYKTRVDVFHAHLLVHAEGSPLFSIIFLVDMVRAAGAGLGLADAEWRSLPSHDLPFLLVLNAIKKCIADALCYSREYNFLCNFRCLRRSFATKSGRRSPPQNHWLCP